MLSLDSLRCFAEAARLLNFRLAARAVALTPTALGQRIQQLEAHLGVRLFHRTTRRVVLTEAGLQMVPYVEQALAAIRDCERAGRGEAAPVPIELTLGTRHELGMSWILPMLPMLLAEHPGLTLHLYFGSSDDLLIRVRSLPNTCAVGSMRLTDPKLESVRLHREDYVFVGHPALLKRCPLLDPAHAAGHTLIDTHAELPLFRYWLDAPEGGDRLRFGRIVRLGTIAAIRECVLAGEGVAVLPLYLVAPDIKAHRLTPVMPKVHLVHDYFRLIFRGDDPYRSLYQSIARSMLRVPLR